MDVYKARRQGTDKQIHIYLTDVILNRLAPSIKQEVSIFCQIYLAHFQSVSIWMVTVYFYGDLYKTIQSLYVLSENFFKLPSRELFQKVDNGNSAR